MTTWRLQGLIEVIKCFNGSVDVFHTGLRSSSGLGGLLGVVIRGGLGEASSLFLALSFYHVAVAAVRGTAIRLVWPKRVPRALSWRRSLWSIFWWVHVFLVVTVTTGLFH